MWLTLISINYHRCPRCRQRLPRSAFYDDPTKTNRFSTYCRPCHTEHIWNHLNSKTATCQFRGCGNTEKIKHLCYNHYRVDLARRNSDFSAKSEIIEAGIRTLPRKQS